MRTWVADRRAFRLVALTCALSVASPLAATAMTPRYDMPGRSAEGTPGRGHFDPILRLHGPWSQEGFNTDFRGNGGAPLDAKSGPGNSHSLRLSSLETVTVDGTEYYALQLVVHEPASARFEDLSLEQLRFYVADRSDIESLGALVSEGDLRWDMDAMGTSDPAVGAAWLERGARGRTSEYLILKSSFAGIDPNKYLYLYSKFGATSGKGSGGPDPGEAEGRYEEWRARVQPPETETAEPGTLFLLGFGLAATAILLRSGNRGNRG